MGLAETVQLFIQEQLTILIVLSLEKNLMKDTLIVYSSSKSPPL